MIERAAAHVGEGCDLDRLFLKEPRDPLKPHQVIQRVIERAKVRIDLLRKITRQKPEPLACLNRRPRQNDAFDRIPLERVDCTSHGKVGFSGAGRADPECNVMAQDLAQILALAGRAALQIGTLSLKLRRRIRIAGAQTDQAKLNVLER